MKTLFAAAIIAALTGEAHAAFVNKTIVGTIKEYACGDNCYLTIVDAQGKEHDGLCAADICRAWNEAAEMPERFIGQKVKVTVTTGMQLDTVNGNKPFDAFNKVVFENAR